MALLTTAEFEEHHETDLGDDAIQRFLDDAEKEIIRRFGEHATQADDVIGGEKNVFLSRPATSITSIVETVDKTDTTLASDDYKSRHGGRQLERLSDGTNQRTRWGDRVLVTYVPVSDTDQRKRVQIDLVKLAMAYEGLQRTQVGAVSLAVGDYEGNREKILSRLAPALGFA